MAGSLPLDSAGVSENSATAVKHKQSVESAIRRRVEALAEPMPDHEVSTVDFDAPRLAWCPPLLWRWVALITVVGVVGIGAVTWARSTGAESAPAVVGVDSRSHGTAHAVPAGAGEAAAPIAALTAAAPAVELAGPAASPTAEPAAVVVSVQGLVGRPGLVTVAPTLRLGELLDHVGGVREPGTIGEVNLAEKIVDGMQVTITEHGGAITLPGAAGGSIARGPANPERAPAALPPAAAASGGAAPININTADEAALATLRGIGPSTAAAIVSHRTAHGPFTAVEQLMEVRGIGAAKFDAIRGSITV